MLKGLLLAAALFALGAQAKLKHLLPLPQQVERVEAAPFALGRPVALTDPHRPPPAFPARTRLLHRPERRRPSGGQD